MHMQELSLSCKIPNNLSVDEYTGYSRIVDFSQLTFTHSAPDNVIYEQALETIKVVWGNTTTSPTVAIHCRDNPNAKPPTV